MAIRSGAGTGVIVSLVVFVLATVFLLVLSIVFYAGNREQVEVVRDAESALQEYATSKERSSDAVQNIVALANNVNQSVTSYLNTQIEERNKMLTGSPSSTIEEIRSEFGNDVSSNSPLAISMNNLKRQLERADSRAKQYKKEKDLAVQANLELEKQSETQSLFAKDEVEKVKNEWQGVQDGANALNNQATEYYNQREGQLKEIRDERLIDITTLREDVKALRKENARLESTIDDLRNKIDSGRMSAVDPAVLVDGTVLEVSTGNEVFIDRGLLDRIVLGMTFEVYDSASQLRVDEDGNFPHGKASIEVVKVGQTTSTAKITRSTTSQPIVRNNIIVNAVYDPRYEYSFMVHGVFDADGDGMPEANNNFIKDQIVRWGGQVVDDSELLPGDLDFLVLGVAPIQPVGKPPKGASDAMQDNYVMQLGAFQTYENLLNQAQAAQIPVLSANRLYILTGQLNR